MVQNLVKSSLKSSCRANFLVKSSRAQVKSVDYKCPTSAQPNTCQIMCVANTCLRHGALCGFATDAF